MGSCSDTDIDLKIEKNLGSDRSALTNGILRIKKP